MEAEAKDGRYLRRKAYPLLWDGQANEVLVSSTSGSALDPIQKLFQETFGHGLVLMDAGQRAVQRAGHHQLSQGLNDVRPSTFLPASGSAEVAWVKDPASASYLGNEFLLWLWFTLEEEGDTLTLGDGSEVAVMLARTLVLECPWALSGSESIRSDAPTQLPKARRAIQAGKLPRQAGLTLVRHDQQYELTLQAETLAVSGAKLPTTEKGEERLRLEERVGQLRHLIETVDLLFDALVRRRLAADWPKELERVQGWLEGQEQDRLAAAG